MISPLRIEDIDAHYRALVDPALTASVIRERERFVRATINELIDEWPFLYFYTVR